MNIYRLNECDWFAANTPEEAAKVAMDVTGSSYDEIVDDEYFTGIPESLNRLVRWGDDDDDLCEQLTIREIIDEMGGVPGYAFGSEC